jgi:putative DNA primase/helicase
MIDLHQVARVMGGDVVAGQALVPGPRHSSVDRSLAIKPSAASPFGFLTHSYAGDDFRECRDYVLDRLGLEREQFRYSQSIKVAPRSDKNGGDNTECARRLWHEAKCPRGTIVETYLASRALDLPVEIAGDVVRFHPSIAWRTDTGEMVRVPAMLTAFRTIVGDDLVAIHRTALTPDGRKTGRKMLGPVSGAAMKLDDDAEVTTGLTIAEGFETALAGRMLGFRPCWALGSVSAVAAFPVLAGIEAVSILTEGGEPSARAVRECGERWHAAGREVIVVTPKIGSDVNDAIKAAAA